MSTINDCLSKWNANPVLVFKLGQMQFRLIFNYYFIYKDILACYIETTANMHDLLNILSCQCLFSTDIKDKYWVVDVYLDDHYYFVFYMAEIRQIQLIHITQKAKILSFIFSGLMNIIFEYILSP